MLYTSEQPVGVDFFELLRLIQKSASCTDHMKTKPLALGAMWGPMWVCPSEANSLSLIYFQTAYFLIYIYILYQVSCLQTHVPQNQWFCTQDLLSSIQTPSVDQVQPVKLVGWESVPEVKHTQNPLKPTQHSCRRYPLASLYCKLTWFHRRILLLRRHSRQRFHWQRSQQPGPVALKTAKLKRVKTHPCVTMAHTQQTTTTDT